ncbi:hypothetical protein AVEN_229065-1 [Araneus ventricosus]|uniref:Uncharacterized protein n=1 Tax=Araneus ventricosus TaxID=182803 RepID=A0A4Y2CZA2_ARAVE|nr:hypothetical protein AVEN_229065-1 [Araneus ventricosus]
MSLSAIGPKKRAPNATSSIHPLSVSLTLLFSSNLAYNDVICLLRPRWSAKKEHYELLSTPTNKLRARTKETDFYKHHVPCTADSILSESLTSSSSEESPTTCSRLLFERCVPVDSQRPTLRCSDARDTPITHEP